MRLSLFVLFLLWGNVDVSLSQNAKPCDNPDDIDNGHYQITRVENFLLGTQISYFCNEGYHMRSNDFTRTCTLDGWAGHVPECHPRSCGHPDDAQFADFQLEKGDDFVFGSQVVYTCHKGYQMVSRSNVRRCMVEGWDGVVPVCEATQCPEIHVDNNVQVIGDVEEATYGNVVRFGCKSNAEILYGSQEIYCDENGEWSGQAPKCAEVKCSVPVIENGEVLGRVTEYKEHETLHFVCNRKYKPAEDRPSKCTKLGQKAEFTPTPVCEQTKCKLQLLRETRYEPHRNVFLPGETLRVFCGNKHWIVDPQSNSAEFTCGDDGNWDNDPVCKEVTCSRPDDRLVTYWHVRISYWGQKISLDDTASYDCASGYRRTGGASQATCTRNGWTPNPLCEVISCGPPGDVQFADVILWRGNDYGFNSQVKYTCHQGYQKVRGSFIRRCTESGWDGEAPVCRVISCGPPADVQFADVVQLRGNDYGLNSQVKYTCRKGYQMVRGSDIRSCTERGWDGEAPVCRAATCQKPQLPNGFMVGPFDGKLYYTCNEDYKLLTEGWWGEAKCNSDELSELRCIGKTSCGPIPEIPNGEVTSQRTSYTDREVVEVRCERGSFRQWPRLTCRQGEWQSDRGSLKETCKPPGISCSPPPKVENAVIMTSYQKEYFSDTEVTYQCRDTHTLMGGKTIKCKNGNWEKLGTTNENISCTPKQCDNPDDIDNGHYNITKGKDFVFGTQITYFCNEGYHMRSNDFTRTCTLDGWTGHVPECHLSSCEHPPKGGGVIVKGLPDHEGDPILPDHFLDFICDDPRKHLSGSSRLRCGKDGQWDNPFPSCEVKCTVTKVSRDVLLPTQHAEGDQLSEGQKLNFACKNDKHVIRGNATVECLPNGEWSDTFPTCQSPVGCERPPPLADGRIQGRSKSKYSHNEKVVYTCQQNYVMEGGPHRTCNNGNWTGDLTCLTLVECGRPPPLADADIEGSLKSKYSHNERVEYTCQQYYVMEGGPHRTCSNGKWTGDLRCLKPCTVTDEAMKQHNIAFKYTYKKKLYSSHNDEIEFRCTGRTTRVGTVTLRQTCIDGEIQLPTCQ